MFCRSGRSHNRPFPTPSTPPYKRQQGSTGKHRNPYVFKFFILNFHITIDDWKSTPQQLQWPSLLATTAAPRATTNTGTRPKAQLSFHGGFHLNVHDLDVIERLVVFVGLGLLNVLHHIGTLEDLEAQRQGQTGYSCRAPIQISPDALLRSCPASPPSVHSGIVRSKSIKHHACHKKHT